MSNINKMREVALGLKPADLLLKNGKIVDVLTESIYEGNVAIVDGIIAGVGDYQQGHEIIDLQGAYASPGFINAHCHVESSMATPEYYCAAELSWGVTTLITDPHEIANVAGAAGIRYMLKAGGSMPINYYVQLPSCVPATPFETSGCIMDAAAMAELIDEPGVLGMGEMMNVPGVLAGDEEILKKLELFKGKLIDGHAPGVTGLPLQAYALSGMNTDHEATQWEEAKAKLRAGIAVLVRQGSASQNLKAILTGALEDGADITNMAFCTDDKHLADIHKEGTIRHCVKMAQELGIPTLKAIRMASINAARIYKLDKLGAIAPGYQADMVVFMNLEALEPLYVFYKGKNALALAEAKLKEGITDFGLLKSSVKVAAFEDTAFALTNFQPDKLYPVIQMLEREIITERTEIKGSELEQALKTTDLCLIAVLERHHATGNIGLGLIKGYGLAKGAIATTVGHDSHNLIVVGKDAESMGRAVRELIAVQGGYTVVVPDAEPVTLPLNIAGLMSSQAATDLSLNLEKMAAYAHAQGVYATVDPFISLSFMALPVIPKLRITDKGMFDVEKFEFCE